MCIFLGTLSSPSMWTWKQLPGRKRWKKSWSPFIWSNKQGSSRCNPLYYSTKNKLRAGIPIKMWMQGPCHTKPVLPGFYFIPTANMDGIIITKYSFDLWASVSSEIEVCDKDRLLNFNATVLTCQAYYSQNLKFWNVENN